MDVAVPAAGALRGALQCAVAVVPECVVAECWMQGGTGEWDQLVAFLTPSPLVATHVGADGKPTQRTIDLATAQAFASQHKLSIKLATKVSMTGATEWCQESEIQNSGDVLLAKLTFGIESAIAVPVMQQRGLEATDVSCPAVLVFYSSKKEQVRQVCCVRGYHLFLPKYCLFVLVSLFFLPCTHVYTSVNCNHWAAEFRGQARQGALP